ncbi:MAG: hypothetical protein ACREB7_13385 [Sphingopyxis sp.]|uniref:hypothetical protein n=1 Tax=Sphingopyxis sp. TaxID=1908224 RepID=UPI003D6D4E3A
MTKKIPLSRPATCAIAAFLALSSPSAFAQEIAAPAAEPVAPPVMVPPVAPTTAPAPVAAPAQPAPVIQVPLEIEPAPVPVAKATPRTAPKTATRAAAARTAAPAPVAAAPAAVASTEVIPADDAASPLPAESLAPVAAMVEPAPAPITETAATNESFPWELAGGAAALLIVGGAGLAFARRRRSGEDEAESAVEYDTAPVAPAMAGPALAREPEPVLAAQPAYALREEQVFTIPVAPVQRSTPAFAAAPSGSMGRHEALALVGPTADNPFLTLKKRLKRARFHDRKERHEYDGLMDQPQVARQPASAWEIANRPEPALAKQTSRRPDQAPLFPGRLRPGFAGS